MVVYTLANGKEILEWVLANKIFQTVITTKAIIRMAFLRVKANLFILMVICMMVIGQKEKLMALVYILRLTERGTKAIG